MSGDRLAVVGTDTGVGKTVVTAGLTRWLREEGYDARAVKPAQTGYPPDDDAGFVATACDDPNAASCPVYLEPALAPRVAAEIAAEPFDYDELRAACERALSGSTVGIVEGIGGLRVPLTGTREVIDLVSDLASDALVVARSGLGTLNHTALSVSALERRDVTVRAVVCNEYDGGSIAERTNPSELRRMTGRPVATVPSLDGTEPRALASQMHEALANEVSVRELIGST